jgi:hypothetical protein
LAPSVEIGYVIRDAKKWDVGVKRGAKDSAGNDGMKLHPCLLMSNPVECFPPILQLESTFVQLFEIDIYRLNPTKTT